MLKPLLERNLGREVSDAQPLPPLTTSASATCVDGKLSEPLSFCWRSAGFVVLLVSVIFGTTIVFVVVVVMVVMVMVMVVVVVVVVVARIALGLLAAH